MRFFLSFFFNLILIHAYAQSFEEPAIERITTEDSLALHWVWHEILKGIEEKDEDLIVSHSLADIMCEMCVEAGNEKSYPESYLIPIQAFIDQSFRYFPGSHLWKVIKTKKYTLFAYSEPFLLQFRKEKTEDSTLYHLFYVTYEPDEWAPGHEGQSHGFQFIKIDDEFKFFGITSIP